MCERFEERVVLETKLLKLSTIYIFSTCLFLFLFAAHSVAVTLSVFLRCSFSFKILRFIQARLSAICNFYGCASRPYISLHGPSFPDGEYPYRVKNISETFSLFIYIPRKKLKFISYESSGWCKLKLLFSGIINVVISLFRIFFPPNSFTVFAALDFILYF